MKKLFAIAVLALAPLFAGAQQPKEVTKFLGIPVDGTQTEMIRKLKEKGFRANPTLDNTVSGEFNGSSVLIHVQANKDKVSRIIVADDFFSDETAIRIRFNQLCSQFENNTKYISFADTAQTISDEEDISYEITVHDKRYQAVFYQKPDFSDFRQSGSAEGGENIDSISMKENAMQLLQLFSDTMNRKVWFMIGNVYGKYFITIYYENGYNMANGEDL